MSNQNSDFKPLPAEEIAKLEGVELINYRTKERKHELEQFKTEHTAEVEKLKATITTENKAAIEEVISKMNDRFAFVEKQNRDMVMLLESYSEKGSRTKAEKNAFVEFIERDRSKEVKAAGFTDSVLKAAALMTTANIVPNATDGFNQLFGNYVDPEIHVVPKQDAFIMNLVDTQIAPGTENIWYVQRINLEGDAAFIGEGDAKPLVDGEYKEFKADVKEVANFWKMSERLMMHTPSIVSNFREHANELIELKMDAGVLTGTGVGDELNGVATLASPFVVPTELANYYEYVNIHDVIMAVATYVRLNNFKGSLTCVLNTVWQAKMMGIKNTQGDYVIPPFVTRDGKQVGEVAVRFENGMADDKILLGDLKKFKVRISEDVKYAEGWESDDFKKNLRSFRLAAFMGTYLPSNYDGSIIYDDIATVEAAIANTAS